MTSFRFNWRLLTGVLIVSAILAVALWPQTIEVDVTRVSRGDLLVTIDEEGETRVRERFVIAAPVAGRLQRIELEPGDRVRRGRTVARLMPAIPSLLDPRTRSEFAASAEAAQAALGQARAERERAAAALERARSVVKRGEELVEAGVISRDQFEADDAAMRAAEEERRAADFAVDRAQHELLIARARLQLPAAAGGEVGVASPTDGTVLKRYRESEADVPAGDPLLEVGNPANLEIVSDVLSTDAVRISPGSRVLIEQWGGNIPLKGRVRRVEPGAFMKTSALGVEEQRVNVIIDFETAGGPPERLGDGYRVEVRVVVAEITNALKIPVGSLFRHGDAWAVFTVSDGRARVSGVQLRQQNDVEAEVIMGLTEGDTVVLHPPDTLTEGARVTERTAASTSERMD
jgi:HlyD family secretion protein